MTCISCGRPTIPVGPQWACEHCGEWLWDGDLSAPVLAVDFDGVIHDPGSTWSPALTHDEVPGAFDALAALQRAGWFVVVFTARSTPDLPVVQAWINFRWLGPGTPPQVTNRKPSALVYIDDRALRFETWESPPLTDPAPNTPLLPA